MRLLITFLLITCIKNSFSQAAAGGSNSASAYYEVVYNQNQAVSDSAKQEGLYRKLKTIVTKYPKDEFSLVLISQAINLTHSQLEVLIRLLDTSVYKSSYKSNADVTLNRVSVAETGKAFPPLTLVDTSGEELSISGLKGKIVFIDVWSSWCVTCREKIPDIRKTYQKYKNKGLEIIGISLDTDKQKWLNAIKKDKQTWKAYCELTNFAKYKNEFAKRFYIYGIPVNYLIDENGILVGQDLSPESLKDWLAQHN